MYAELGLMFPLLQSLPHQLPLQQQIDDELLCRFHSNHLPSDDASLMVSFFSPILFYFFFFLQTMVFLFMLCSVF